LVPDRALPLVSVDPSDSYHHSSRDTHPLAPLWLSLLLALEVAIFGRPAADRGQAACVDPADEYNPLWGAPRIHGELLKLGFEVAQASVAKYMVKRRRPPSQGWLAFLRNHAPDIATMDFFVVPTIGFDFLYAFVIVRIETAGNSSGSTSKRIRQRNG
jgi:hypothetical protein